MTLTTTHWFPPDFRLCKAILRSKGGTLSIKINVALAKIGEIPKGRGEFCAQRLKLPFRSDDRFGQFNTLAAKFASRQCAVVNVNSP